MVTGPPPASRTLECWRAWKPHRSRQARSRARGTSATASATACSTALTALASILGVLVVFAIIWRVADGAWPAIKFFKLGFLWHNAVERQPERRTFGARDLIIGTVVTSFGAMLLAGPISIAIGLFLSELAPPAVRASGRDA